jgi:hypothetical protein
VLARLPLEESDLLGVGYAGGIGTDPRRLHSGLPWHLAFPPNLLRQWATRNPLRAHESSWPAASQTDAQALTSGYLDRACPHCQQQLHRLLRLASVPPGIGINSCERVEFVWCAWCGPYADVSYVRHDSNGTPVDVVMTFVIDPPDPEPEDWSIPATEVELIRLDQRWWQQDWALSNDRENLHRIGGEPTWIQAAHYPSCPHCGDRMISAGQISIADLWDGEGICYLMWCDQCATSGVIYQQT